jgi:uncharacterized protein YhaN
LKSRGEAKKEIEKILAQYKCDSMDAAKELLNEHERLYGERKAGMELRKKALEMLEEAKDEQARLDAALLQNLDFSSGDGDAAKYSRILEQEETRLRRIREENAEWQGRQTALGDSEDLRDKINGLLAEYEQQSLEYDALTLAALTLKEAAAEIQNRITPKLSRRTADIFAQLTASRYDSVVLDRQLDAAAKLSEDSVSRETSFMSMGAVDQLYLAVRLAICELALPADKPCPLIFDDALVTFDDERCIFALELLREIAKTRQIILFTCHSREVMFMRGCADVHVVYL